MSKNRGNMRAAKNIGFGLFIVLYLLGVGVTLGWVCAAVFGGTILAAAIIRPFLPRLQYGPLWVLRSNR